MALVFARKNEESIRIGNDIKITIYRIQKDQVHVAITAPRHIPVDREEIYLKKRMQQNIEGLSNDS